MENVPTQKSFTLFEFNPLMECGTLADDGQGTKIKRFFCDSNIATKALIKNEGGCFAYVRGDSTAHVLVISENQAFIVSAGFWFSTPGGFILESGFGDADVVIFQKSDYRGTLSQGMVEDDGRLNYIDGCKDSILYAPIKKGLPCFNALYMPSNIHQTMHTHPSTRAGLIIKSGKGIFCETPTGVYHLKEGDVFFLPADVEHKFRTDQADDDSELMLVAYHPDSDFGPEDENHPMINRTIVEGVSASHIDTIRTR